MKLVQVAEQNKKYYTKDFIHGFNTGAKTQYEADSKERRGRWEHYEHREPQYDIEGYRTWAEAYKCSNCGFIHTVIEDFGHYAFCPNCGADMREAKNGCDDCFIPMFYNLEDDDSICRDCGVGE